MFIVIALAAVVAVAVPVIQAVRRLLAALPASNADFSPF